MLREAFLVEEIRYFMKNWALGKKITIDDFFYQLTSYDGLLLHKTEPNKFIVKIMTRRYDRYHQHGGGWLQTHCCKGATPQVKRGSIVREYTWTNWRLSEKRMRHTNNSTGKAKTHQKCVTQGRDVRWKLRNTDWGNSLQQQTLLILSLWTLPVVQPPVQADDGDSLPSPPPSRNTSSLETARYSCRRTPRWGKQRFLIRDLWPEACRVSLGPPTSHFQHRKEGVQGKFSPFCSKGIPWETSVRRLNYRHRCVEKCHLLQDRDEE